MRWIPLPGSQGGFGSGGGARVEREPHAENYADHRNEVFFKLEIGYPCESEEMRLRGDKPYRKESDRLTWTSGQLYLTGAAPRNAHEEVMLVTEIAERVRREMQTRPLRTMRAYAAR